MYSLHLRCDPGEVDELSARLWDLGTVGVQEIDGYQANSDPCTLLIAGFETNAFRAELLALFEKHTPEWVAEEAIDWIAETEKAWPARAIGLRLFLAPHWSTDPTPDGRIRIIHNPGLACGTGEHPCTQLALEALEGEIGPETSTVLDLGTGSGILAIAARNLGAAQVAGVDLDEAALKFARENFDLNRLTAKLIAGSVECIKDDWADVTVANISGSVLLSCLDDLLRVTKKGGRLVLTGFPESESQTFLEFLPTASVTACNEWRCLSATVESQIQE